MDRLLLTMLFMSFRHYVLPPNMKSHHWIYGEKHLFLLDTFRLASKQLWDCSQSVHCAVF